MSEIASSVNVDAHTKNDAVKKAQKTRKRNKKKSRKQRLAENSQRKNSEVRENDNSLSDVEIEYVVKPIDASVLKKELKMDEESLQQFSELFKHFQTGKPEEDDEEYPVHNSSQAPEEDEDDEENDGSDQPLSKKKLKKIQRLTVAELKQLVKKPEAVEWWDVAASDPRLLVSLKSYRNTVPVPAHWSQKRKYLQGKRGIEKPPWELPDFIKDTGIMEMREAVREKENSAGLKGKMKEKVAPRMGKLDVDYQKLHDAFFRFQTRPKFTIHGEVYYEGKEFETRLKEQKPGQLTTALKDALNMPPLAPPPWLINMQRYGPPPSYSNLKIAGLNAPIPEGAQWGYHPGGWGRPPVDEYNRPLYGDVFGISQPDTTPPEIIEPIDKQVWGELEPEEEYDEEEEEEEEEAEEEEEEEQPQEGHDGTSISQDAADGLETPSGIASVASGLETPAHIELRKDRKRDEDEGPKQLYHVLPEVKKSISGFMGSQHGYDMTSINETTSTSKRKSDNVEVAIDPSELEKGLDESTIRAKYDAEQKSKMAFGNNSEDFSDIYAEHAQKQAKRMKTQKR